MMLRIEESGMCWPLTVIPPEQFETVMVADHHPAWTPAERAAITAIQRKLSTGVPVTYRDTQPLRLSVRYLSTAEGVAERAREWFRDRALLEEQYLKSRNPEDHWSNRDAQQRFTEALFSGNAIVVGPNEVHAFVPARCWADGAVGEALDHAGRYLTTARIRPIDSAAPDHVQDLRAGLITW